VNLSPGISIAVASGKGGTGKTSLAAHLALAASKRFRTLLIDLDVEAPDCLAYFPSLKRSGDPQPVTIRTPRFDSRTCIGCGRCAKVCRFGVIVALGRVVAVSENLCKGCGRCVSACPSGSLFEEETVTGLTTAYNNLGIKLIEGRLSVGDIRSTAVIEATKLRALHSDAEIIIRDCPPGTSCPATHAIHGADYTLLVAEPTEFSLHDLKAALCLVSGRRESSGVVVNKIGSGKADIEGLCREFRVPIVGRIAFSEARAVMGASATLWDKDAGLMKEIERILSTASRAALKSREGSQSTWSQQRL
jgi:MinD superfamily P-loop ATPase